MWDRFYRTCLFICASSTFAWYQSDRTAATVNDVNNISSGTLTVGESSASSANEFTITPTAVVLSGTVAYTDAAGKTYVSIPKQGGGYTEKEATTEAAKAVTIALKATVTYSGDLEDKADVKALWDATVASVTLTVSCSGVTGTAVAGSFATSDIRGVSSTAANAAGDLFITKATNASPFTTWSSATSTGELTFGNVYVALTGSNSLVVDAEHLPIYTLKIAATHVAA